MGREEVLRCGGRRAAMVVGEKGTGLFLLDRSKFLIFWLGLVEGMFGILKKLTNNKRFD